jgi:L-alanine-DL-glutamate epimerase-like enolase superfamily enzyme
MMHQTDNPRIVAVEWAELEGRRPRPAGRNARLGEHGVTVRVPLARLTSEDGKQGFGVARADEEDARRLLGRPLDELFNPEVGSRPDGRPFDFPLWDLVGKVTGEPVYRLAAQTLEKSADSPLRVPCYDTSLYFDDLHLADQDAAAQLLAEETAQGLERGHRNFKIKVGRGARHLPLEEGTERDIAIIRAVRRTAGPDAHLMIDANNGYNLNLAKRVLIETAESNLFWLEEAFHEDAELYADLKEWLTAQGLPVLIADGEGQAAPSLPDWARAGLVDVLQYDIFSYGFTPWLTLGERLDGWGVRSAPHHYGRHLGNYVSAHLAAAIDGFTFAEWDEATTPGVDAPGYRIEEGHLLVPDAPGFGLILDDERFQRAVAANGFAVTVDEEW